MLGCSSHSSVLSRSLSIYITIGRSDKNSLTCVAGSTVLPSRTSLLTVNYYSVIVNISAITLDLAVRNLVSQCNVLLVLCETHPLFRGYLGISIFCENESNVPPYTVEVLYH